MKGVTLHPESMFGCQKDDPELDDSDGLEERPRSQRDSARRYHDCQVIVLPPSPSLVDRVGTQRADCCQKSLAPLACTHL